jgi:hypothetical protein
MVKGSFIMYTSFYEPLKMLSEKQLGKLLKAIFEYQINGNIQVDSDIQMAFAFIKNQMDIDEGKYQEKVRKNAENGRRGGRPPKEDIQPEKANGFLESEKSERFLEKPKKAYNDNEDDNENDITLPLTPSLPPDQPPSNEPPVPPPPAEPTWRESYDVYLHEVREAYDRIINDEQYIKQQSKLNPGVDVKMSIKKACVNFWATEAGWKHKGKDKFKTINWKSTFGNSISIQSNKVYFPR